MLGEDELDEPPMVALRRNAGMGLVVIVMMAMLNV